MARIVVLALPQNAAEEAALMQRFSAVFGKNNVTSAYNPALNTMPTATRKPRFRMTARLFAPTQIIVMLIGPDWANGLAEQHPQVVVDIQRLLRYYGVMLLLPVLVQHASMPPVAQLPSAIQPLAQLQAMPLRTGPETEQDLQALVRRLQEYNQSFQGRRNFRPLKLLTFYPVAALIAFALLSALFQISAVDKLSLIQYALSFILAGSMFVTLLVLWPLDVYAALLARRFRWALVNGLLPPVTVAIAFVTPIDALPKPWSTIVAGILVVLFIGAWYILPIVFGLTLPTLPTKKGASTIGR